MWAFPCSAATAALKTVTLNRGHLERVSHERASARDENKWYESDLYANARLRLRHDDARVHLHLVHEPRRLSWHNVQELAVKVSFDDSGALGKGALKPYALVAFELGDGGADGVSKKGTYVELGIAPGYSADQGVGGVPDQDRPEREGLLRVRTAKTASSVTSAWPASSTVPINSNWNVHGGGELQVFGDKLGSTGSAIRATAATAASRPSASASRRMASSPGRGLMSRIMNVRRVAAALGAAAALVWATAGIGAEHGTRIPGR